MEIFFLIHAVFVPICLGVAFWHGMEHDSSIKALEQTFGKPNQATFTPQILEQLPVLLPLRCSRCSAGVLLEPERVFCPYCQHVDELPIAYAEAMQLKKQVGRVWQATLQAVRVAKFFTSTTAGWVLVILAVFELWLLQFSPEWNNTIATVLQRSESDFGRNTVLSLLPFLGVIGIVGGISTVGLCIITGGMRHELRQKIPALTQLPTTAQGTMLEQCRSCSATIQLENGEFAALCPYCNVENYREQYTSSNLATHYKALEHKQAFLLTALKINNDYLGVGVVFASIIFCGVLGMVLIGLVLTPILEIFG